MLQSYAMLGIRMMPRAGQDERSHDDATPSVRFIGFLRSRVVLTLRQHVYMLKSHAKLDSSGRDHWQDDEATPSESSDRRSLNEI